MSTDNTNQARVISLAGILTPVVAIVIARVVLSAGPAQAPAAVPDAPVFQVASQPHGSTPAELTGTQAAALDYLNANSLDHDARSPMAFQVVTRTESDSPVVVDHEPALTDPRDQLELSSIVGKGNRAFASISGRIYRIGDEVTADWRIAEIRVASREVVLVHRDGQEIVLGQDSDG